MTYTNHKLPRIDYLLPLVWPLNDSIITCCLHVFVSVCLPRCVCVCVSVWGQGPEEAVEELSRLTSLDSEVDPEPGVVLFLLASIVNRTLSAPPPPPPLNLANKVDNFSAVSTRHSIG